MKKKKLTPEQKRFRDLRIKQGLGKPLTPEEQVFVDKKLALRRRLYNLKRSQKQARKRVIFEETRQTPFERLQAIIDQMRGYSHAKQHLIVAVLLRIRPIHSFYDLTDSQIERLQSLAFDADSNPRPEFQDSINRIGQQLGYVRNQQKVQETS